MKAVCRFALAAGLMLAAAPALHARQAVAPPDPQAKPAEQKPAPKPEQKPEPKPDEPPKYEETVVVSASRTEEKLVNAPATMTVIGEQTLQTCVRGLLRFRLTDGGAVRGRVLPAFCVRPEDPRERPDPDDRGGCRGDRHDRSPIPVHRAGIHRHRSVVAGSGVVGRRTHPVDVQRPCVVVVGMRLAGAHSARLVPSARRTAVNPG